MSFLSFILGFFHSQLFVEPAYPKQSCEGKTIITGANVGLGYEAAKHFVRLGSEKVILACRNLEKGQRAAESIEKEEHRNGVVEVWELDLGSYESVKAFAKWVDGLKRIDAVVENAGVATGTYAITEDNETTITTNVVSTFLLALLLLPILKRSATTHNTTPTLTIVSSEVHYFTSFPERNAQPSIFEHLNDKSTANMNDRYNVSKMLDVLTVRELCQKIIPQPYPVTLNTVNPGFCNSSLAREMEGNWGMWLMKKILARSTEVGSRTLVIAALAGRETHGEYLSDGVIAETAPLVRSEEGKRAQARVWKELSGKLEAIQPGILNNI
ncbi:putative short-chain dehydrogenase [Delphinella strobiligena]|nr:putative short-chain dehydrogenase [Delphinella strobiligena]